MSNACAKSDGGLERSSVSPQSKRSQHTCAFDKWPVLKLPETTSFELQNLASFPVTDSSLRETLYVVTHGCNATVIRQPSVGKSMVKYASGKSPEKPALLRKLPYDSLEPITAAQWLTLRKGVVVLVIATDNGKLHIYDWTGTTQLRVVDCNHKEKEKTQLVSVTSVCGNSHTGEIIAGLSSGRVVAFSTSHSSLRSLSSLISTVSDKANTLRIDSTPLTVFKASAAITCVVCDERASNSQLFVGTETGSVLRLTSAVGASTVAKAFVTRVIKHTATFDAVTCMRVSAQSVAIATHHGFVYVIPKTGIEDPTQIIRHRPHTLAITALDVIQRGETTRILTASEDECVKMLACDLRSHTINETFSLNFANTFLCGALFGLDQLVERKMQPKSASDEILLLTAFERNGVLIVKANAQ